MYDKTSNVHLTFRETQLCLRRRQMSPFTRNCWVRLWSTSMLMLRWVSFRWFFFLRTHFYNSFYCFLFNYLVIFFIIKCKLIQMEIILLSESERQGTPCIGCQFITWLKWLYLETKPQKCRNCTKSFFLHWSVVEMTVIFHMYFQREPYNWNGQVSPPAWTVLTHHAVQTDLSPLQQAIMWVLMEE